ncbi:MAG TPA: hypothetical protein PK375_10435 [Rhodocyclaceae bacterium]|nr:hypothetical protein [Rhodocyclaceae bacterium]
MARHKPSNRSQDSLRRAIASAAARLMAEDGIGDYGAAKRKAARSLGVGEGEALPSNDEVADELRAYHAIFQEDEQKLRLMELRGAALEVMHFLTDFRPYLTGSVLDGTAARYAEIEIDLYADSAKDVEISLLSRNMPYEAAGGRPTGPEGPEAQLRLEWNGNPVLLSIFSRDDERRQRRNPRSGRTQARARADAVEALLAESAP